VEVVIVNIDRMRGLLAAALVGLFVALVAMFLALAGVISMALAQVVLAFAFLVGAAFIWWEVFPDGSKRRRTVVICALAIALTGLDWWTLKQKRTHLYVSRTQFLLDNNLPNLPQNVVDIFFRNDGDMDAHVVEFIKIKNAPSFSDEDKQRAIENEMFDELVASLAKATDTELKRHEFELAAHGEQFMSHEIPAPYSSISRMPDALYFMGRLTYTDENGAHHTDFCNYIHNRPEPIFSCKGHNEAP
jgi:hypothetical protein